ncbi:MAG: YeeE/YedE thiosulfate transporter family protein [Gemmatimonadota bacterium]|nr:YeeE/YedE thiosulfate transporter family protein [Gemmatimonadota bacterium]
MATGTAQSAATQSSLATRPERLWPYAVIGIVLGIVFTRSEVVSWFRIQEMFRFQSFHMYGIIGSAVAVGAVGVWLIKRFEIRSVTNHPMRIPTDRFEVPGYQYWLGGTAFGLGWGLLGACPGPIYVLIGNGVTVMFVAFLSALVGVWTYGAMRHRLPHS